MPFCAVLFLLTQVEVIALSLVDGRVLAGPLVSYTDPVLSAPRAPPKRYVTADLCSTLTACCAVLCCAELLRTACLYLKLSELLFFVRQNRSLVCIINRYLEFRFAIAHVFLC
jgi:hypothetical protein